MNSRTKAFLRVILGALLLSGCSFGTAEDAFTVVVRNDTDNSVVVFSCENWSNDKKCAKKWTDDGTLVSAGKSTSVIVHGEGMNNAVPGELTIRDAKSKKKLGCIPYRFDDYYVDETVKFDVTQGLRSACGRKTVVEPVDDGALYCEGEEGRALTSCS